MSVAPSRTRRPDAQQEADDAETSRHSTRLGDQVVRIMMGIIILITGYQKFAGGVGAVATGFEKIPIPLPWLAALFISTLELVGGALLIVGLGVR